MQSNNHLYDDYRPTKWHDPFVLYGCLLFLIPVVLYGIMCGIIRDTIKPPKSTKTCMNSGKQ
jgi:hypothetical protein